MALGRPMEVPILVRTLADTFIMPNKVGRVHFDHNLMAVLDAGVDHDERGCLVQQYEYNWWDMEAKPEPEYIFYNLTVVECLVTHYKQMPKKTKEKPQHPIPVLKSADRPSADADCPHCRANEGRIRDLLVELQKTWEYADSIQVSTETKWNCDMRQAAGFYQLHHSALIKELNSASSTASAPAPTSSHTPALARRSSQSKRGISKSEEFRERALADLERLKASPQPSHKWVWGTDLTEAEVRNMGKSSKGKQKIHSGYNISLSEGNLPGSISDPSISSEFTPSVSPLASDILEPPQAGMQIFPAPLGKFPSRHRVLFLEPDSASADADSPGCTAADAAAEHHFTSAGRTTFLEAAKAWSDGSSNHSKRSDTYYPEATTFDAVDDDVIDPETANACTVVTASDAADANAANTFPQFPIVTASDAADAFMSDDDSVNTDAANACAVVTASDAADAFLSEDNSAGADAANTFPQFPIVTASDAADAFMSDDDSVNTDAANACAVVTASDAADAFLSKDNSAGADAAMAFPVVTASDAADAFLSEDDSVDANAFPIATASQAASAFLSDDSSGSTESLHATRPRHSYSGLDFSFIDETWVPDMQVDDEQEGDSGDDMYI
ncbi:hypothetical protein JOM56_012088 [Amanita muscaria]